jgi:glycosyltransferase involved in cell wall biosynthesis
VLTHLRRLLLSTLFDVIDFAEYGAEGFMFQLDRTNHESVPIVVQLHGPLTMFAEHIGWPDKDSDLFRVGSFIEDYSIHHADALMACSANIADFTAAYHGVDRDRIDVVHCGVDAEAFRPRDARSAANAGPAVLFVGNLAWSKGLGTAFEAVLGLRAQFPTIRLQVAGKPDEEILRELTFRAAQAGAESAVEYLGFLGRDEIGAVYRDADVFCSPATHEPGVANVYIEAMASGCPVVAGNTGGAPEAVLHEQTGILVTPNDVGATTRAIDRLLTDPSLRHRFSRAARQRVEEYFAMDRYIGRVLACYERAIGTYEARRHTTDDGQRAVK